MTILAALNVATRLDTFQLMGKTACFEPTKKEMEAALSVLEAAGQRGAWSADLIRDHLSGASVYTA